MWVFGQLALSHNIHFFELVITCPIFMLFKLIMVWRSKVALFGSAISLSIAVGEAKGKCCSLIRAALYLNIALMSIDHGSYNR